MLEQLAYPVFQKAALYKRRYLFQLFPLPHFVKYLFPGLYFGFGNLRCQLHAFLIQSCNLTVCLVNLIPDF